MQRPQAERLSFRFTRLAWANLGAQSAEQIGIAAATLFAVLSLGAGAGETGLLLTVQTLPYLLLSIPAGVLADRVSKRRLMTAAEAIRTLSLGAMLALVLTVGASLPLLAVLGFVGGCGTIAFQVAAPALVPSLVPAGELPRANSRVELARTLAFTAGPALAGVIVGRTGAPPAFGIAAALSLCAVLLLGGLPEPRRRDAPRRNPLRDIGEGLRFVVGHRILLPVLITQLIFNTAWFVIQAAYTPYAVHHLHLSASGVGATLAVYGVGLLIGVLAAPRVLRSLPFGLAIGTGPLCGLVAALVMVLTIAVPSFLLASLSFLLLGAGPALWVVSTTTLRQRITPPRMLGRVSAVFLVASGSRSLGTALVALVGGRLGADACLEIAAAGFAAQAVLILLSPAVHLVRLPEPEAERSAA